MFYQGLSGNFNNIFNFTDEAEEKAKLFNQ